MDAAGATGEAEPMSAANLERLLMHLDADGLAARLVAARLANPNDDPKEVLEQVIKARLQELKSKHEPDSKT